MKRQWEPEELIEQFILTPAELAILPEEVTNANPSNRLGFAVLLKFFQVESRFPQHPVEVPKVVVHFIAQQLKLTEEDYRRYPWSGGRFKAHRNQIRSFLGFRPIAQSDKPLMKTWLMEDVLPLGLSFEALKAQVYQRFRQLKIEPPVWKQLERLIRSAARAHEREFCRGIAAQLSAQTGKKLDALLDTESPLTDETGHFRQSQMNQLKSDPGRLGLNSLLAEIEKLQCIQALGLPDSLFASVAPKLVQQYRRRASTEPPRELRRHPSAIRYTLVAAFCWQREQEIIDGLVTLLVQIVHRLSLNAERRVERELVAAFKRVPRKEALLLKIAVASLQSSRWPSKKSCIQSLVQRPCKRWSMSRRPGPPIKKRCIPASGPPICTITAAWFRPS
jgi:hypothetical protein